MPRVVIVGAGFGGLHAARALRNVPVQVAVIDRNNHHLFQPLLYQVATVVLFPAEIAAPIRSVLRKQKNTEVLLGEVMGVDTQAQRVLLDDDQSVPYDYLILATGARDSYFGHNHWAQCAPGLKSIVQATAIRRKILQSFEMAEWETDPEKHRALLTFVLVGAGPTGVEMAGAIAGLAHKTLISDFRHIKPQQARIVLVEALPRILLAFDERLAKKAHTALDRLGVEVRTNSPVEAIDSEGVVMAGERIPAKTVIWTAGVAASRQESGWMLKRTEEGASRSAVMYLFQGIPTSLSLGIRPVLPRMASRCRESLRWRSSKDSMSLPSLLTGSLANHIPRLFAMLIKGIWPRWDATIASFRLASFAPPVC